MDHKERTRLHVVGPGKLTEDEFEEAWADGEAEPEQADGLTQSKAREFVEWRGTEVEVVD